MAFLALLLTRRYKYTTSNQSYIIYTVVRLQKVLGYGFGYWGNAQYWVRVRDSTTANTD